MRDRKKIIGYLFLLMLYVMIVIFMLLLHDKKEVRFFVKKAEYIPQKISVIDPIETNDCVFDANKNLQITGKDPFIIYDVEPVWVWDVSINISDDYKGYYKIYYGWDCIFSEKNVGKADGSNGDFIVGGYINSLRVDFEQAAIGDFYNVKQYEEVYLNSRERTDFVNTFAKEIKYGLPFFAFAIAYILSRIIRKRYKNLPIIYFYSILINYIWIIAAMNNAEIFMKIWIFILSCIGLFFMGNIKRIEEKE